MENIEPVKPYRVVRDDFGQIQSSDAVAHISQPANSRSKGREFNQTSVETIIHIAFAHQLLRQSPEKGPWLFNASLYGVDESISQRRNPLLFAVWTGEIGAGARAFRPRHGG